MTPPTPEELQDALRRIEEFHQEFLEIMHENNDDAADIFTMNKTIQFALRFTAKALGEPDPTKNTPMYRRIFKAIIQQIAKECAE